MASIDVVTFADTRPVLRLNLKATSQHPATLFFKPGCCSLRVLHRGRTPQPLSYCRSSGPRAADHIRGIHVFSPYAGFSALHERLLLGRPFEVMRIAVVVLLPVDTIANYVQVPAARQKGFETGCGHCTHVPLERILPHVHHSVWRNLNFVIEYFLPHHVVLLYPLNNIQQPFYVKFFELAVVPRNANLGHEFRNVRVRFPAIEANFVSSQMNVLVGKHFCHLRKQRLEEIVSSIRTRINRSKFTAGFCSLVARRQEIRKGLAPRPSVSRRVEFGHDANASRSSFSDYILHIFWLVHADFRIIGTLFAHAGELLAHVGKDSSSTMCQWRTFILLYDIASNVSIMDSSGRKCRPVSIRRPR
uniref:Uncharacterized protein n=1 Tax=Rhipicephalus microplus TaxID=6941 RepID=A0A6G5AGU5_RHIMP